MEGRSVLVVTVVHHPEDSRIRHREIAALLNAGWAVTYAAPFTGYGSAPAPVPGLRTLDLPRSVARDRLRALRAARRLLRREARRHDVVLVHDPELLVAAAGLGIDHLVWDVHEDPGAALTVKEWLPLPLRRVGARAWRVVERLAERRWTLLLAEHAYQRRFRRPHTVVPNGVVVPADVPPPGRDRVVYLGTVTLARGCAPLVEVARRLRERTGGECVVEVVGPAADAGSRALLTAAAAEGALVWHGFVPSDEALPLLDGALAGLSLLEDLPNYRPSMPTKVVEYLAHGVPAVTTPLPLPADLVVSSGAGVVVPFDDAEAATAAVLGLRDDEQRRVAMGRAGHARALAGYDWTALSADFVAALGRVARPRP